MHVADENLVDGHVRVVHRIGAAGLQHAIQNALAAIEHKAFRTGFDQGAGVGAEGRAGCVGGDVQQGGACPQQCNVDQGRLCGLSVQ